MVLVENLEQKTKKTEIASWLAFVGVFGFHVHIETIPDLASKSHYFHIIFHPSGIVVGFQSSNYFIILIQSSLIYFSQVQISWW